MRNMIYAAAIAAIGLAAPAIAQVQGGAQGSSAYTPPPNFSNPYGNPYGGNTAPAAWTRPRVPEGRNSIPDRNEHSGTRVLPAKE